MHNPIQSYIRQEVLMNAVNKGAIVGFFCMEISKKELLGRYQRGTKL